MPETNSVWSLTLTNRTRNSLLHAHVHERIVSVLHIDQSPSLHQDPDSPGFAASIALTKSSGATPRPVHQSLGRNDPPEASAHSPSTGHPPASSLASGDCLQESGKSLQRFSQTQSALRLLLIGPSEAFRLEPCNLPKAKLSPRWSLPYSYLHYLDVTTLTTCESSHLPFHNSKTSLKILFTEKACNNLTSVAWCSRKTFDNILHLSEQPVVVF